MYCYVFHVAREQVPLICVFHIMMLGIRSMLIPIYVFHVARKHINIVFHVAREHIDMVSTAPSMNLYISCSPVTQNGLICRNISIIH